MTCCTHVLLALPALMHCLHYQPQLQARLLTEQSRINMQFVLTSRKETADTCLIICLLHDVPAAAGSTMGCVLQHK
jgi:hypothetical protein